MLKMSKKKLKRSRAIMLVCFICAIAGIVGGIAIDKLWMSIVGAFFFGVGYYCLRLIREAFRCPHCNHYLLAFNQWSKNPVKAYAKKCPICEESIGLELIEE